VIQFFIISGLYCYQNILKKIFGIVEFFMNLLIYLNNNNFNILQGDRNPLVVDNKIAGIVSTSQSCALGYPDIFSRVYFYLDCKQDSLAK
jgi:hypothetical protein